MQTTQFPEPPSLPLFLPGQLTEVLEVAIVALVALVVLWPLMAALARRIDRRDGEPALRGEVNDLRARLTELEAAQGRVADLEERLDFAERLLAQQREAARLPGSPE
jgi:flagellar biosynthesis/type III secretory pathway M-ring protein FliF/YscJ